MDDCNGYNENYRRRINNMQKWIDNIDEADKNAEYAYTLNIDMNQIKEPILCAPNPDDAELSEVNGDKINEVFIGSYDKYRPFRAAGKLLNSYDGEADYG